VQPGARIVSVPIDYGSVASTRAGVYLVLRSPRLALLRVHALCCLGAPARPEAGHLRRIGQGHRLRSGAFVRGRPDTGGSTPHRSCAAAAAVTRSAWFAVWNRGERGRRGDPRACLDSSSLRRTFSLLSLEVALQSALQPLQRAHSDLSHERWSQLGGSSLPAGRVTAKCGTLCTIDLGRRAACSLESPMLLPPPCRCPRTRSRCDRSESFSHLTAPAAHRARRQCATMGGDPSAS